MSSLRLCGRNHADWNSVGCTENAAPFSLDSVSRKWIGSIMRSVTMCLERSGMYRSSRYLMIVSRYGLPAVAQSVGLSRCGTGEST